MSTFSDDPSSFGTHTAYVNLLKTAVKKVRAEPGTKFLYYKDYLFGTHKKPLMLLDHHANCQTVLAGKGIKPTAAGLVSLTEKDELDFRVKHGKLNRIQLKKYFESMPGTMKPVFVANDDADVNEDEADGEDVAAALAKPKPLPKIPSQAQPRPEPTTQSSAAPTQTPQAKPKPLPSVPPELIQRVEDLRRMTLVAEWEAKKDETLKKALTLLQNGERRNAELVLDALAGKSLAKASAKPLPTPPTRANVAAVQQVKADILSELEDSASEGDESGESEDEDDDSGEEVVLDSPAAKKAALAPASSVASAQQRLAQEEEAFKLRKTIKKAEKIKVSASQQEKEKKEQEAKDAKKAEKAKAKEEAGDKGLLGFLSFERKKDGKDDTAAKEEQNRIDRALANKKTDDEIRKFVGKPLGALGKAGIAEKGLATGVGQAIGPGLTGDDIASAAGAIATSTAGVATSLMNTFREFRLYAHTSGAERTVHLKKAMEALGGAFGNLVNLTKGSLNVAEHAGALEAGSAVPILGIVAAVPTLLKEINQLRSAMTRLAKQEKMHAALEAQMKTGDASQATLHTLVSGFIARDAEAVGKGITRVTLDFTKIAGHGVSAGGITGPIGVALVAVGSAGKLVLSGIDIAEGLLDANKANDRRKKLQPTLKAPGEWKELRKEKPDAKENVELTAALQALVKAEKGTKDHAEALERVIAGAEAVKQANAGQANPGQKQALEFATRLLAQAKQEKESWKESGEGDDDEQGQGPDAQDPHQRNARKLIKRDPQIAAQVLLDQAQREGPPGGPAFQVLKSFGIKAKQVYSDAEGDERIASNREMRQKILYKLGADDETAQTLSQKLGGAKDGVKDYLSMGKKHQELADYMAAKNLLQHGGEAKRGKGWRLKMDILTDDVEEKKEALLGQVDYLVQNKDIDETVANEARALLRPRKEKPKSA